MFIAQKILMFILVFAILVCIRELANFVLTFIDDRRSSLDITKGRLILLACSISYIVTIIFTGFKLF